MVEPPADGRVFLDAFVGALRTERLHGVERACRRPTADDEHTERRDADAQHNGLANFVRRQPVEGNLRNHRQGVTRADERGEARDGAGLRAGGPVDGAARQADEQERHHAGPDDGIRRRSAGNPDKACDAEHRGGGHERNAAFFGDEAIDERERQKAYGACTLDGQLAQGGARSAEVAHARLEEQRRFQEHEEEQGERAEQRQMLGVVLAHARLLLRSLAFGSAPDCDFLPVENRRSAEGRPTCLFAVLNIVTVNLSRFA